MSSSQWDWSTTAGSNTTVGGVSIAEGMNPANVNNAMRAIMAGLKNSTWGGTSAGTANAQTVSLGNAPAAYVAGMAIWFLGGNTNTGATTLDVNSLGTKNVFANNAACSGGEIQSGELHLVVYDGTQFQLQRDVASHRIFDEQGPDPTTAANQGAIYAKDIGGDTLPVWRKQSDGDVLPMTDNVNSASSQTQNSTASASYVDTGLSVTFTPRYTGDVFVIAKTAGRIVEAAGASAIAQYQLINSTTATVLDDTQLGGGGTGLTSFQLYGSATMQAPQNALTVDTTYTFKVQMRVLAGDTAYAQADNFGGTILVFETPE